MGENKNPIWILIETHLLVDKGKKTLFKKNANLNSGVVKRVLIMATLRKNSLDFLR